MADEENQGLEEIIETPADENPEETIEQAPAKPTGLRAGSIDSNSIELIW